MKPSAPVMKPSARGALTAAIIGSATVFLDGTIVNVALPRIGASLPAVAIGVLEGQVYIVAGYMATLAAFLMLAGALGDQYGRRRMFLVGLIGFGATSLACGLAPSLDVLAGARLVQGVAGALLVPGSLAIITTVFEGPARARAFGIWAAATSVVVVLGPPIGGALVELFGWRSIFLLNLPLIALGVGLTLRFVPAPPVGHTRARFDLLGAVVAAVAVGGLSFGAIRGQQVSWSEAGPPVVLGIGVPRGALSLMLDRQGARPRGMVVPGERERIKHRCQMSRCPRHSHRRRLRPQAGARHPIRRRARPASPTPMCRTGSLP